MLTLRQENPQNFSPLRKWTVTVMLGLMTIPVAFTSSVFGTAMQPTSRQFGVSQEVMVLGTSLFVLGFSFGPSIFGPLSELYGRKMPLFVGFFIFAVFRITVAVAQNLQTIFVRRFLGGVFSSGPLAIVWLFFIFLGCDEANDKGWRNTGRYIRPCRPCNCCRDIRSKYLHWPRGRPCYRRLHYHVVFLVAAGPNKSQPSWPPSLARSVFSSSRRLSILS